MQVIPAYSCVLTVENFEGDKNCPLSLTGAQDEALMVDDADVDAGGADVV